MFGFSPFSPRRIGLVALILMTGTAQLWTHAVEVDLLLAPGAASHEGNGIVIDADRNIYVTGQLSASSFRDGVLYADIFGSTLVVDRNTEYYLLKYSSTGERLWIRTAGGSLSDYGTGVRLTANQEPVVTLALTTNLFHGISLPYAGKADIVLARYSSSGDLLWATSAGGASDDVAKGLAIDSAGDIYVVGRVDGPANFGTTQIGQNFQGRSFLAKYTSGGELLWVKQIGSSRGDVGITIDSSDKIYVTGNSSGEISGVSGEGVFLAEYNTQGIAAWVKIFPAGTTDGGTTVVKLNDGALLVAGTHQEDLTLGNTTLTSVNRALRGFVARFTADGTPVWAHPAGGRAYSVAGSPEGTAYATGFFGVNYPNIGGQTPPVVAANDAFVLEVSSAGEVRQVQAFGSTSADIFRATHFGHDGLLYVTGEANGPAFGRDPWDGAVVVARFSAGSSPQPVLPSIEVGHNGNHLEISWPPSVTGYILEATDDLARAFGALPAAVTPMEGIVNRYRVGPEARQLFLRLIKEQP
jgi:hypothetical protein